ncbi:hypothetical protein C5B41_17040 [Acinetobacter ursingii]|nr:hypothetical protein [Acinetobacter ursingii]PPZ93061.1 hypothetical protein C5B41_17040 [Acinetobacter ursingii]
MAEHIEDIKNPATTEVVGSKASKIDSIVNNYSGKDVEDFVAKFVEMSNDAQANDAHEKSMTLREGIATFPKAAFWSVVLSTAIIMEGFDTNLLASYTTRQVSKYTTVDTILILVNIKFRQNGKLLYPWL